MSKEIIMERYVDECLDKIQLESYISNYKNLIRPCIRPWEKKLKMIKKRFIGFLVGSLPGIMYATWMTKGGMLYNIVMQKCIIKATKELINKTKDIKKLINIKNH